MKLLKTFGILYLSFILNFARGQNLECELFQKAIETDYFKNGFLICKMDSVIKIYDKKQVLHPCSEFTICNKLLKINTDTSYNKLSPDRSNRSIPNSLISLYDIIKEGNKYTLYFWQPHTNRSVTLTYKVIRKKKRLIKYTSGIF